MNNFEEWDIETLRVRYKELEEINGTLASALNISVAHNKESIPISVIQNKIDEITEEIKHEDNEKVIVWLHKQRKVLQELLKERNK